MTKLLFLSFFLCLIILIFFLSFYFSKKRLRRIEELKSERDLDQQKLTESEEDIEDVEEKSEKKYEVDQLETAKNRELEEAREEKEQILEKSQETNNLDKVEDELAKIEIEQPKVEKESKKREMFPGDRGGGPRRAHKHPEKKRVDITKSQQPKIDIVCWKEGFNWIIGAEVTENVENFYLYQNGEVLEKESSREYRFRLKDLKGQLRATWNDGEKIIPLLSQEKQHLVFKTRKNWNELGRLVKFATLGFYIIVVPEGWKRDLDLAGNVPIEPENIHISDYKAHFFHLEDSEDGNIGFVSVENELIPVKIVSQGFQLKGKVIEDASENMGPIFVEKPPILGANESVWRDVGLIVVGEEGPGKGKWRMHFVPQKNVEEQVFPYELEKRNGGWFFVRFYNEDDDLLESLDFRFMKSLHDIKVSKYKNLPGDKGHKPVELEFYHEKDCEICLESGSEKGVKIFPEDQKTRAVIPSDPCWDVSDWKIKCGRAKIEIEIMIERIWWDVIDEIEQTDSIIPDRFVDIPLILSPDSFLPTSKKVFCIWFPRPRWAKEVFVGLDEKSKRKFPFRISDRYIIIPLRDFYDVDINFSTGKVDLRVWIKRYDGSLDSATICRIEPEIQDEEGVTEEEKKEEAEAKETLISPRNKPCCGTCDHARKKYNPQEKSNNYWCRRYHWPRIHWYEYEKKYSHFCCAEWRGEYFDLEGKYRTS